MSKKLVVAGSIVFIGFDALIGCLSKILWQRQVLTWYSRQITLCIKQLSLTHSFFFHARKQLSLIHSFFPTWGNNYHLPPLFPTWGNKLWTTWRFSYYYICNISQHLKGVESHMFVCVSCWHYIKGFQLSRKYKIHVFTIFNFIVVYKIFI